MVSTCKSVPNRFCKITFIFVTKMQREEMNGTRDGGRNSRERVKLYRDYRMEQRYWTSYRYGIFVNLLHGGVYVYSYTYQHRSNRYRTLESVRLQDCENFVQCIKFLLHQHGCRAVTSDESALLFKYPYLFLVKNINCLRTKWRISKSICVVHDSFTIDSGGRRSTILGDTYSCIRVFRR